MTIAATVLTLASAGNALAGTETSAGIRRHDTAVAAAHAAVAKQPVKLGFYDGATVRYFDFGEINLKPGNKLAPIWSFTNGAPGQHNIIDTVPGLTSYSPLWQVEKVTWAASLTWTHP